MIDEIDYIQRILEGRCPACGHELPEHSIVCNQEEYDRLLKLKNAIAKRNIIDTVKKVKDQKDV